MIATENYPSWYGKDAGRTTKVKDEPTARPPNDPHHRLARP